MNDPEILTEVRRLCDARQYDEAIAMTDRISNGLHAIRAHLLVMEHEERYRLDQQSYE